MQSKSFLILLLLLVIAGTGVFMLEQQGNHHAEREPLLKGVDLAMLNKTEKLILQGGAHGGAISLIRDEDDDWYVEQKDNHPADVVKIRKLLTKLLETRRLEFKTDREDQYTELGLQIPSTDGTDEAKAVQLDIYAPGLHKTLILGFDVQQFNNAQYVRILQEGGSWLINRRFDLDTNPVNWLNRQIVHIEPAEIHKINIHFPDKQDIRLVRAKRGDPLTLLDVPQGMQQKEGTAISELATITDYLEFYEVIKKENDYTPPADAMTATFISFNGLELHYKGYKKDDQSYAAFSARLNEAVHQQFVGDKLEMKAKVLKDIKKLRDRFDLWYYKIKGSVQNMLTTDMSRLTEPKQASEAEAETPPQQ